MYPILYSLPLWLLPCSLSIGVSCSYHLQPAIRLERQPCKYITGLSCRYYTYMSINVTK